MKKIYNKNFLKAKSYLPANATHQALPAGKLKASEGFTLIELLVVIAIIGLLSGISFMNFRAGESNLALQRSAQALTQSIAQAQNFSLGGKLHNGTASMGGYGIRVKKNNDFVIIFADCNANGEFDQSGDKSACEEAEVGGSGALSRYPEEYSKVYLEEGVIINDVNPGGGNPLDIVFVPPDPDVTFFPALGGEEAYIEIQNSQGDVIRVYINKLGAMRIE